jgi:hypothetical protein
MSRTKLTRAGSHSKVNGAAIGFPIDRATRQQLAVSVEDGDADTCSVRIVSDIVYIRRGSPFAGKHPSFDNSEATTVGAIFHKAA